MRCALVRGHADEHDEVAAVTCRRKHAAPLRCLVDGTVVVRELLELAREGRHKQQHGQRLEEHLGRRLVEQEAVVHASALEVGPVHERTVLRAHLGRARDELEVKVHGVDRDLILARVVLQRARHERLREEEGGHVKEDRDAVVAPPLEEDEPAHQISHVRRERLERRERLLEPHPRDLVCEARFRDGLQVIAHHDQALEGFEDVLQAATDRRDELVEARELLRQHRVHRLLVEHRVALGHGLDVVVRGQLCEDVVGQVGDDFVKALLATAAAAARVERGTGEENRREQAVGLVQVLGDVGVFVQPEDLWRGEERQGADEARRVVD
mmetsp:Transcript_24192/g.61279  ORF Transcript_24192/g.61279 Transcript_24192/m.61279 type:complete len:326 (-) Transcript_24192:157-1134(-)